MKDESILEDGSLDRAGAPPRRGRERWYFGRWRIDVSRASFIQHQVFRPGPGQPRHICTAARSIGRRRAFQSCRYAYALYQASTPEVAGAEIGLPGEPCHIAELMTSRALVLLNLVRCSF